MKVCAGLIRWLGAQNAVRKLTAPALQSKTLHFQLTRRLRITNASRYCGRQTLDAAKRQQLTSVDQTVHELIKPAYRAIAVGPDDIVDCPSACFMTSI
jgi:hypothetical protein